MTPGLRLTIFHLLCDTPWYFLMCVPLYDYLRIPKRRVYMLILGAALFRAATTYLPELMFSDWPADSFSVNVTYYCLMAGLVLYAFRLEIMALIYSFLLVYTFATSANYIAGAALTSFFPEMDRSTTLLYSAAVMLLIIASFPFLLGFFKGMVKSALYEISPVEFKFLCITPASYLILSESYVYIAQRYGMPRFSLITISILVVGVTGCIINLRMILDSARKNRQLRELNSDLEEKVAERTRDFQEQVQIAETANKAKSAFLATMSHEVRTPLNAIIGLSHIGDDPFRDVRADLGKIHDAGHSLLGLINEILDISKIESGSFELVLAEYSTPSLINNAVEVNRIRITGRPVEFILEVSENLPERLIGDELRIRQILNNLLSNAFKYTREGEVILSVKGRPSGDELELIFSVLDTGIGIKEEDMEKLFQEYSQFDQKANRAIEGTGLGLSITKRLVEFMDGSIHVESTYGKGTTFTVRIPQKLAGAEPIGKDLAEQLQAFHFFDKSHEMFDRAYMPNGKVLVVDDVVTNLDVAKSLLRPYGLEVDCVTGGREAIDRLRNGAVRYDLVFMDHMMPEMDGVETVRHIRSLQGDYAKTVPIIALTANIMNTGTNLPMGFNDILAKPIDVKKLDQILNTYIEGSAGPRPSPPSVANWQVGYPDELDIDEGIARYGSPEAYRELLRSYSVHTPGLLKLLEGVSEETLPSYAVTVHGIKGSSYGICANGIAKRAEMLEMAAKAGDYGLITRENSQFIDDVGKMIGKFRGLLPAEVQKEKRAEPDKELLLRLRDACAGYQITEMDALLTEMERFEYQTDLVPWLREQVGNLEYAAILERLEETFTFAFPLE